MERRGFSQAELAREVGVADTQISRWRRGHVTPTVRHLQRIADTLGVPRAQLDRMAGYPVSMTLVEYGDPEAEAELQAHIARFTLLLEQKIPRELWRTYNDACEALAETLKASFAEAQRRLEAEIEHCQELPEVQRRHIGFRTDE